MIYLDYHATTPVDPRVAAKVLHAMTDGFGNPSSTDHAIGDRAATAIKTATHHIAHLIGASPRDILFTSGATESLNLAIQGTLNPLTPLSLAGRGVGGEGSLAGRGAGGESSRSGKGNTQNPSQETQRASLPRVAISAVEHKAVLDTCTALQQQGRIDLIHLPVNRQAQIDLDQLEHTCASGLHLLCVMAANNEVGTLYPIETIAAIAQRYHVPFLCDAAQAVGKIPLRYNDWGITLLSLSGHKLYAPQGIGALVVRRGHPLTPLLYGGGHQQGLRPGTLNLPGIVGLGEACRLRSLEMTQDEREIGQNRDRMQTLLTAQIPDLVINGDPNHRLAGNLHLSVPGIPNSAVIARVRHHLAISTGSACTSGVEAPSHVLTAMHLPDPLIEGALRIGLGKFTTDAEVTQAADLLIAAITDIRRLL